MRPRVPFAERGGSLRGLVDLATGGYPAFLFGGPLTGVLPVFHFHEVTTGWLEPRLRFLAENGYRSVSCDQIARFVIDGGDPGPRRVGLTFDDAWASVWTVAAPLLRKYDLTAILFAIPGRVPEALSVRPAGVEDGPVFATWPEVCALHASGLMDVQSHTLSHAMVFCHDAVLGFVTPEFAHEPLLARLDAQQTPETGDKDELADDASASDDCVTDDAIDRARAGLQARIGRTRARIDGDQPPEPGGLTDRDLRRALNAAEHAELARLYDDGTISQPTRLRLQHSLDLEAARLSDDQH